jgi:threonyl-tRNA synthetase
LEKIEGGMLDIISEGQKFINSFVTRDQAIAMMESKNQTYKLERLAHIPVTEKNFIAYE